MPTDLAALLVNEGAVAGPTLEQALARQAELGGALDTALLELGVDEAVLLDALSRATDLPAAPPGAWEAADARARRVFPSRVAERHGLAPFALDGRELSLVATYPVDLGLLDEISFMLSLHLTAHVGPEWRVRALIHRLYGGTLDPRLARLAEQRGGEGAAAAPVLDLAREAAEEQAEREAAAEPHPEAAPEPEGEPAPADGDGAPDAAVDARAEAEPEPAPSAEELEPPRSRPAPVQFGLDEGEPLEPLAAALAQALESDGFQWLDDAVQDLGPGETEEPGATGTAGAPLPPPAPEPPPDRTAPPRWTLAEAREALGAARTRDEVVLVALRYARDFFEFAALFAVTRDAVAGYDALGVDDDARDRCRGTAIYTTDPGIFRTVIDTRAPYLGPVAGGQSGNEAILGGLGRATPRTVLVAPVVLRDRTVCVVYADNGEAPVSARRLGDLLLLLATVGGAFERLIRERKQRRPGGLGPAPAASPGPAAPKGVKPAKPGPEAPPAVAPVRELAPAPIAEAEAPTAPPRAPEQAVEPAAQAEPRPPAGPPGPAEAWRTREPALANVPEFDIDVDEVDEEAGAGTPEGEIARLVKTTSGSPRRAECMARLAAMGDDAVQALVQALPGPLDDEQAQEPARLGPIPAALALHGAAALPMLLGVLQEADPARRRCAATLLGVGAEPSAFGPLADRALDADPRVAAAAAFALARNRAHPAMRTVPDKLRRALLSGVAARVNGAARALGALRDLESIPLLIQVLETSAGETAAAAADALTKITLQRIGAEPRKWLAWWKDNRGRGRAEWLFSGLTSPDRAVRAAAAMELSEAAPSPVQYDPDASPAERANAARAWAGWWSRSGRVL